MKPLKTLISKFRFKSKKKRESSSTPIPPSEERPKIGLIEHFDMVGFSLFGGLTRKLTNAFELQRAIKAAGLHIDPAVYTGRVLLLTLIVAFCVGGLTSTVILSNLGMAQKVFITFLLWIGPVMTFAIGFIYPSLVARGRAEKLDHELPFVAAYITSMARGGIPVNKVLEKLADSDLFPAMRKEARLVLRDVRMFGKDFLSAMEDHALVHPNRYYRDFILGYISTIRVGGDILNYLENKTQSLFEVRATAIKTIADRMSMLTEVYITLAVIMALSFYVFFSVSTIISPGGMYSSITNFILFAFVALPSISMIMLGLIHKSQPKTPIKLTAPYKFFALSLIPGGIILFVLLYLTGALNDLLATKITLNTIHSVNFVLTIFLVVIAIPAALAFSMESRRLRGYERHVASFLRELSEVRKTGLSPEKCIVYVSRRDYGNLTPIIRNLARMIEWGFSLRKSVMRVTEKLKNWFALAILGFLVDAIEVGGGSVSTLETLTRFTNFLSELEVELKSKLRTYVVMPYFGALLTAVSTLLVINFIVSTLQAAAIEGLAQAAIPIELIVLLFTVSIIINSWLMGVVAGKISTMYTAGGFSHAILLTVVTYIAVEITTLMILTPLLTAPMPAV